MLRSNGEDFDKPLARRTRPPLGTMGMPHPTEAAFQPEQGEGEHTGLLNAQAVEISRRENQRCVEMVTVQGYRIFAFQGSPPKVTPFQPDRITGPVQFILGLLRSWNLTPVDMVALLGFEQADQANVEAILAGRLSLRGRDVKDRIAVLFRIKSLVSELFRDGEYAWMGTPRPEFANRSPLEMLREGSMENLLTLRQYVEHISGL